jgi:hypothetical protein
MRPPTAFVELGEVEANRQEYQHVIMQTMPALAGLTFLLNFGDPNITEGGALAFAPLADAFEGVSDMQRLPISIRPVGQSDKPRAEAETTVLHILFMQTGGSLNGTIKAFVPDFLRVENERVTC